MRHRSSFLPLVAAATLASGTAAAQTAEELNRQASALFEQRRPAEAAALLERSLALQPRQPVVAKLLGLCYQLTEDEEKAEAAFRRAAELNPQDAEVWFFLGRHYYKMNFFERALEALERSRRLNGRDPRVHTFIGLALEATGDVDAAERAHRKAVELNARLPAPSFRPHYSYGALLAKLERLEESEKQLRRAVELEPNLWEPHFELAKLLYKKGKPEAAVPALERALATRTAKPEEAARIYHLLARALFDLGRAEEAAEALRLREKLAP
jgi:tetratricopeptide (TPR) repeat protein